MYNDLNKELFRKYFLLDKRENIRTEAINFFSDIVYFEEHIVGCSHGVWSTREKIISLINK